MKYLIAAFLISSAAMADCTESTGQQQVTDQLEIKTDVPSHLKGATIIVRTKDGRETQVPAERFKVVPRKQQFVVTHTLQETTVSCNNTSKNRVSGLIGKGTQSGVNTDNSQAPNKVSVENNTGTVGGVQYQRMLNDTISIGVQGQTNKTGSLLLGIDF